MKIAVAAETVKPNSGLGHFLVTGLERLANLNPHWRFHVVTGRQTAAFFREACPSASNVHLHVWDETDTVRWLRKFVRIRGRDRLIRIGARHAPGSRIRAVLGNLSALWQSLPDCDAVWVPHFDISSTVSPAQYEPHTIPCPILVTIHDLQPAFYPQDWSEGALANFSGGLSNLAHASAAVVTHTEFQQSDIVSLFNVDAGKIGVTPAPPLLRVHLLNASRMENGGAHEPDIDRPFFLYPGSSGFSHKNHQRLLQAWALLREEYGDACPTLVCTCRGHQWSRLAETVDRHDLGDFVVFTGLVPLAHLADLYRQSSAVIVPTLYEGGGSGPVAEAILLGRPVLCSDIPPIREQIDAYGTAHPLWFDPLDPRSIAGAVRAFLEESERLKNQARLNQRTLVDAEPRLWDNWGSFYSERFMQIAS